MKKSRLLIIVFLLILSIGFAAVSTVLYINGEVAVGTNINDFDVYFNYAKLDNVDVTNSVITDKKHIVFNSSDLKSIGDKSELIYEVTNDSTQYDASVSIDCGNLNNTYYSVKLNPDNFIVNAGRVKQGKVEIELIKSSNENRDFNLDCELEVNAISRTSIGEKVMVPRVVGGSDEWTTGTTIEVDSTQVVENLDYYEYYYSLDETTPTRQMSATGKGSSVTLNTTGAYKVYFRSVLKDGSVSDWSEVAEANVDVDVPVITNVSGASTVWARSRTFNITGTGDRYEYFTVSNLTVKPSSNTEAQGYLDKDNMTVEKLVNPYIYFRPVNRAGIKGEWSNAYNLYVDYDLKCNYGQVCSYTGSSGQTIMYGTFLAIDSSKTYNVSITAKAINSNSNYYFGIAEYDSDYLMINTSMTNWISGSTTYLTKALKKGDTVVYLANASGFISSTASYHNGFIFWNYKNSTGYQYPKETYSRNYGFDVYTSSKINKSNNTITLKSAWQGDEVPAGTYLSQSTSMNTFNYGVYIGSVPSSYTTYAANYTGTATNSYLSHGFMYPTKYVKLLSLHNYGGSGTATLDISTFNIRQV